MKRSCRKIFIGGLAIIIVLIGFAAVMKTTLFANAYKGGLSGTGRIENTGGFADVFNVVLPVVPEKPVVENTPSSSIYDFILDPKQLASGLDKYNGMNFEPGSTLYFKNESGSQYDFSSKSDTLSIRNKSTMSVNVGVEASLEGMDGIKLVNDDIFDNDKGATVYLAVEDSNSKISAIDKYGAFLRAVIPGRPDAYKIGYDTVNHKYGYKLKSDAELSTENISFFDYSFWLTGACNSADKWPDLNGVIEPIMTVVWTVSPRPQNAAPYIGKNTYAMTTGRPIAIDVDLGSGNLAASGIKEIRFTRTSGEGAVLPISNYSLENGMLKFNADYISALIATNLVSRDYTVVFNDKAQTKIKITLRADDEAPSIEEKDYHMVSGQPLEIDVNLGSGQLGATGIKEIRFVRVSNETAVLPSTNYVFANGKLRFKAAFITNLIASGITSRDYIVVFNDKAGTEIPINLALNGEAPSISINAYTMTRGETVEIETELGTEDLEATGVSEIAFTRASGEKVTLTADNYTFADGRITISAEYITSLVNAGVISRDYTITFNNVVNTQAKITLTADDKAPSIEEKTYEMVNGQPLQIDVELGSGNLGATGISAVTFTRASGEIVTVTTDKYVLVDGKLKFRAAYITELITAGVTSRDYTVVFNDKASTKKIITLAVNGTKPSISTNEYVMERGRAVDVAVDLGVNDLAATGISEIRFTRNSGEIAVLPTSNYTFTNSKLQFNADYISALIDGGTASRDYMVIFNDVASTQIKITLRADDESPSIEEKTYRMINGQPLQIDVELGSGNLGATGISAVTFTRASGEIVTVTTDKYVLVDGKLKFRAAYITELITVGVTSRTYTVAFNDKASTKKTVTLAVDGQVPSIREKNYTMERGKAVEVTVDLGNGDLAAKGISEIRFMRDTGEAAVLPTGNYTFTGGKLQFNAAYISDLINAIVARDYTIVFDNMTKTKEVIRLTAKEVSPSIKGSVFSMVRNQPVEITVDLGSGTSRATSIKSIAFTRDSGAAAILPTSNYVFADGVLRFRAAYITSLIDAGTTSRPYTITFNDKAATKQTVTLQKK